MKDRLDKILVSKGLVKSREIAKALIMEGKVFVDGRRLTKAGTLIDESSSITVSDSEQRYVSRGGLKLEAALNFFNIDVTDKIAMDVGASTGGFTDCLLKRGARKVYCIDVGYGQLDWTLRNDPRIIILERTNIRYLDKILSERFKKFKSEEIEDLIKCNIDLATIDVSFISLTKVIPVVINFIKEKGEIIALLKPQFEVGKREVDKGGIIREDEKRFKAIKSVVDFSHQIGIKTKDVFRSPIQGRKGNVEFFLYMKKE